MSLTHVDDLLDLPDALFVDALYRDILGRAPDVEGRRYYLGLVRSGVRKAAIVRRVALSAEGRRCAITLSGLPEFLAEEKKESYPWRRLFSWGRRIERQLYRIENELGRKALLMQPADTQSGFNSSLGQDISVHGGNFLPDQTRHLTRRGREILGRLVF